MAKIDNQKFLDQLYYEFLECKEPPGDAETVFRACANIYYQHVTGADKPSPGLYSDILSDMWAKNPGMEEEQVFKKCIAEYILYVVASQIS